MSLLLLFGGDAGVTGTGAITLGSFTVSGAGGAGPSGTGSIALSSFTVSGSGTASSPATTTGCDHLNEDGGLNLNEDGGIALLEGCAVPAPEPTGGGYAARSPRGAYLDPIHRDDEELILVMT